MPRKYEVYGIILAVLLLLICLLYAYIPKGKAMNQSAITKEKAIEIAIADVEKTKFKIGKDYQIDAELKDNRWQVYWYIPDTKGGGAPEYLIDAQTGTIINKRFSK